MSVTKSPGEAAAISGYDFQYEVLATELYNRLLNDEIEWVEFASADAGKLDDVLVGLQDKIIAYQVKEISSSKFSYNEFTTSDTESIFKGAFKGWQKLKSAYPGKVIEARFITTQEVSAHDNIAAFEGKPKPSFEKFVKNFWKEVQDGKYDTATLPKAWKPVANELAGLVNTSIADLIAFIKEFSFVFEYKLNDYLFDSYTRSKREAHIDAITKKIFRLVAKNGTVKFTRSQFLNEFGLKNNFETRFQHAFFVDDSHYQPLDDTIRQLESLVCAKPGGYIALVGNAGSGKSTLLTKWLSDDRYRVLKYLAYTNLDMNYGSGYRGEAKFFLHDIIVQIRENKLAHQDRLPENDVPDLQRHLQEELQKLSLSGDKVFITVDGLDHISREQNVDRSLISVLPEPKSIPQNIYFILGSRTLEQLAELSFEIRDDLKDTDSIVTISPLTKTQIANLLASYQIQLPEELFELLFINTKGHPLFLRYTLEELKKAPTLTYEAIITDKKFDGDILKEYRKFWEKNKNFDEFTHILGIISRFRYTYFDLDLLRYFKIKGADADKVNAVAEFYFYKSDNIWQFFHNSFKEFLVEESARDRFSKKVVSKTGEDFHLEIAAAMKETENEYRFNVLYHLFKAGQFAAVTKLITQDYFREQWFASRNSQIITEDINLAAQCCYEERDLKGLTVCFFSHFELQQRTTNFPPGQYYDLFLMAGWLDVACSFVFDSVRLLTTPVAALDFSKLLFREGYTTLAAELFGRAAPVSLLDNKRSLSRRRYARDGYSETDEVELVTTWAVTATLFLPLAGVITRLVNMQIESEADDEPDTALLPVALKAIADFYIDSRDLEKLAEITEIVDIEMPPAARFDYYFDLITVLNKTDKLYAKCMAFFNEWEPADGEQQNLRHALVYAVIETDIAKCKPIFERLPTPAELKEQISPVSEAAISNYIFNYARIFYIVYKDFTVLPETLIPKSGKPAVNAFNLAYAQLALSYAWLFYDYQDASTGFFSSIERIFAIFHYRFLHPMYDMDISRAKGTLVTRILKVALQISNQLFEGLLEKINKEWREFDTYWRTGETQEIIEWVIESGKNTTWCIDRLKELNDKIFDYGYVNERIEQGVRQAKLWVKAGDRNVAGEIIRTLTSIALNVRGEDDPQLDYLVDWISKFQPYDTDEIQYYLDRLDSIKENVNSASMTPADKLLSLSLGFGNGYAIFESLLFGGIVDATDGTAAILEYLVIQNGKERALALKLFPRIVVSLDHSHTVRRTFIRSLFKSGASLKEISGLVSDMNIYCMLESRNDYLFEIQQQLQEYGIEPAKVDLVNRIEEKPDGNGSSGTLRLGSGESFSEHELFAKVRTLEDIIELAGQEEKYGHFDWTNLVIQVIPATDEQTLDAYLAKNNPDTRDAIKIAGSLQNNGKTALARNLLLRAIDATRYSGWGSLYDGGGKLEIYQALETIDAKPALQDRAFKDFAFNLSELGIRTMEMHLKQLDKLYSVFTGGSHNRMIYDEILVYRNELVKNQKVAAGPAVNGKQDDAGLLTGLLCFFITLPSSMTEAIYPLLIAESGNMRSVIDTVLSKLIAEGLTIKFLKLLAGLAKKDSNFIRDYGDKLKELIEDKRFDVFLLAAQLLEDGGIDWDRKTEVTVVPLGYTLGLSVQPGIVDANKRRINHIDPEGFLKETNDPLEFTRIATVEIKKLAGLTGFEAYNIAYRVQTLSTDPQFPAWAAGLSEPRLRGAYSGSFKLDISYKRPQVQKVFSGLMKVVMELIDLGLIDIEDAVEMAPFFDELLYFIPVSPRPSFIKTILSPQGSAPSADRKWAARVNPGYVSDVLQLTYDDRYILAESTTLDGMGHGTASENRQSFVDVFTKRYQEWHLSYPDVQTAKMEAYPELESASLCICNAVRTTNPKENWLAVNPVVAASLGLRYNPHKGIFRWEDTNGKAVIESLYWQDGEPANRSGHHHSEAGNGWLVTISRDGMAKLVESLHGKKLYQHKKIQRQLTFVQQQYDTDINESGKAFHIEELKL